MMQNSVTLNDITKQVTFRNDLEFPKIYSNNFLQVFEIPENLKLNNTTRI